MHINEVRVIAIDLHHLLFVVAVNINGMLCRDMFMRKDAMGFSVRVAWSIEVVQLHIVLLLMLVNSEVEVLLCDNLVVLVVCEGFGSNLVFELK